nr:hypothetical protein [Halomicronema hongdechloris]
MADVLVVDGYIRAIASTLAGSDIPAAAAVIRAQGQILGSRASRSLQP